MDKRLVARNFSRYAHLYDSYADIQRKSASRLLDCIKGSDFTSILELGCGTGNFTLSLRDKFKDTRIKALDISRKMVEIAEKKLQSSNVEFIVSDAEEIVWPEKFDLVISHACFQWFTDLEKALERCQGMLKENGHIVFSAFGPLTFQELNVTLKSVLKSASIQADFFLNKENLKSMLGKYFGETQIQEVRYEEYFLSLKDLLCKIKYSGIRGSGIGNRIQIGRRILEELEKEYLNRFSRIKATYQVFFCQGGKI
jgi:malonyl-CoA O-methyltransferase